MMKMRINRICLPVLFVLVGFLVNQPAKALKRSNALNTATPSPAPIELVGYGQVTVDETKLLLGPAPEEFVLKRLKVGTVVETKRIQLDENGERWVQVAYSGIEGYIAGKDIEMLTEAEAVDLTRKLTAEPMVSAQSSIDTPEPAIEVLKHNTLMINDTITLGTLQADGVTRNIVWRVIRVDGNRALLISDSVLLKLPFHTEKENVSWASCTLRDWLNGAFWQTAFSNREKDAILLTTLSNDAKQGVPQNATGGKETEDRVFLLSYKEASSFFASSIARQAKTLNGEVCSWWLRSISDTRKGAAITKTDGSCKATRPVNSMGNGVRPAIWVQIDKLP